MVPRSLSLFLALALALAVLAVAAAALAEARPAALVKDVYPGSTPSLDTNTQYFTLVDDLQFFVADDGDHGAELWKSDGTATGTVLVKDLATAITETLVPGSSSELMLPSAQAPGG